MFFRKSLSYLIFGLMAGSPSISLMAAEGEVLNSFASPTSFSSGQAWINEYLYLLDRGSKTVHKIDPSSGSSIYSFPVTHTGDLTSAHNFIWISDPIKDEIIKVDAVDGQVLKTLPSPGAAPAGLAYDGTYLWNVDWMDNTVYKLNPVDGTVISSFTSPTTGGRAYGLTWDGVALWMVDWVDDTIYQVNSSDGVVIKSFPAPGPNSQGLAWDGKYLWVSDYDVDTIFKIDSGSDAPGVMGCVEVEGSALSGVILLSQSSKEDQQQALIDGCFVFSEITSGLSVTLSITEESSGEDVIVPVITLLGDDEITIETGTMFTDPGAIANDNVDGDVSSSIIVTGNVDTTVTGDYSLTYDVSDIAGNQATSAIRTVHVVDDISVVDTVAPVITLVGAESLDIPLNGTYTEEGATASDNVDGDLTNSVTVTGVVNTDILGTYIVSYNVSDEAGNAAETISRTVNVTDVADTEAPVISLSGASTITIEQGANYSDEGATASDNNDGDITNNIVTTGSVDASSVGTYVLSYDVSDLAGNSALTITRTIIVQDTVAPILTLNGSSPQYHEQETSFTDLGAVATDDSNGDISDSIVVTGSVNSNESGSYTLTYNVNDSSGNAAAPIIREVIVRDTTAPVLLLQGDNPLSVAVNTPFTDPGAIAYDSIEGDLNASVVTTGIVDTSTIGTYTRTYNVSDSIGNSSPTLTRIVHVVATQDTTAPAISLAGDNPIYVEQGSVFTDPGASATDDQDGDISNKIQVTGTVNINSAGTYILRYNVSDLAGNNASEVTRNVIVRDTTIPVISVKGSNTVTVAQHSAYNDEGATAQDNIDGDLTSDITASNNVNTGVAGTYTVIYNVNDAAGNSALQQIRTVNVVFECTEFTSSNSNHESAGRAYSETTGAWFWEKTTWYATGSGADLGTSGNTTTTLSESSEGYFNNGSCN